MSREARREVGDLLADQLEAMEADLHARAIKQSVEYRRRVEIIEAKLHDIPCSCRVVKECDRCYLLRVAQGDE